MHNIVSNALGIILVVLLLFIAPLKISSECQQMVATRELLNLTQNFIDEAADVGEISEDNLTQYYSDCAATGLQINPIVTIERRVIGPDLTTSDTTDTYTSYYPTTEYDDLHSGDIIKIQVKSLGYSQVQYLVRKVTGWGSNTVNFTLAGRVR